MPLDTFLALVLRLATGILAIQDPSTPVSPVDAVAWATAAAYHGTSNRLDPFQLVAIARNESDFQPDQVGPDGKDCGLTQTRITYSRYRCKQLREDPWLAFAEAARELSQFQAMCRRKAPHDLTRCTINGYNSGVRYAKRGWAGAYWLRVSCFAEAARAGVTPRWNCRKVGSRGDIARLLAASSRPAPGSMAAAEKKPAKPR